MATLTEISSISRKVIKYGAVSIVFLSLLPVFIRLGKMAYLRLNPPPPPPPTVKYGKIPALQFPSINESWPEFKLETIDGALPNLGPTAKVYLVGINKARLLLLERIIPRARTFGFMDYPLEIDDQSYRFVNTKTKAEMKVNLVYGSLTYNFDWTTKPGAASSHSMPQGQSAINQARAALSRLIDLPQDLTTGPAKVTYYIATGSAMMPTDSVYDANFTRVDLMRNDKDKMKVMTPGVDSSPVNVLLSGWIGDNDVLQINYYYSQMYDNDFATYPIKTSEQAWKDLIEQRAYIARKSVPNVVIRKVYLAYYESMTPQLYLQPIFVFEGDGGFTAYVQAIDQTLIAE